MSVDKPTSNEPVVFVYAEQLGLSAAQMFLLCPEAPVEWDAEGRPYWRLQDVAGVSQRGCPTCGDGFQI